MLLAPLAALGANHIVTSLGDSGPGTLRDAIAASGDGDVITFSVTGAIHLTSGSLVIVHNITINGPGANLLEVTRTAGVFGIFNINIDLHTTDPVSISGLAITNGHSDFGSGIRSNARTLTLSNCIMSGNASDDGAGAIYAGDNFYHSVVTLTNCTFSNNTAGAGDGVAYGLGGAISSDFVSELTATNCVFANNTASVSGGAINQNSTRSSSLTLSNCTFTNNSASNGRGGAIYNTAGGLGSTRLSITQCTFTGNNASDAGGALDVSGAVGTVGNCTFFNNTSGTSGGGLYNLDNNLTLLNDTFVNNTASTGGGIYNEGTGNGFQSNITVSSCTISGNVALNGGGIYNTGTNGGNSFVHLDNTILKTGGNGTNLANTGLGTSISSNGYNLCNDDGGAFLTAVGDQINTNPMLGPLQDNGGPTATMALLVGSPAQDKGKSTGTDQRGVARPVDIASIPNAPGGNGADIGAIEMSSIPPIIVTTTADHNDGVCNSDCTLREAVNASNSAVGTNTILFSSSVTGTISLIRALGTLAVNDGVLIVGPGARILSVSGSEDIRIFNFNSGISTLSGLTIRDGWQTTGFSGDGASHFGGAIYNHATLAVTACAFTNNFVAGANNISAAAAGGNGQGGAIFNDANLTLTNSTFAAPNISSANVVVGGGGGSTTAQAGTGGPGGVAQGGAVYNSGTLIANNCTFANNAAAGGGGGSDTNHFGGHGGEGSGAAIYNAAGSMTITACTMSGNQGVGGAGGTGNSTFQNGSPGNGNGGIKSGGGASSTIRSAIVAGNLGNNFGGKDVEGAFISNGYNLVGTTDQSTGFTGTADQAGTNAAMINATLGPLQNNGGDTDTLALLQGSLAIDAGKNFGSLATDQRGQARTVDHPLIANASGGDGTDIGAFELQTPPLSLAGAVSRLTHGAAGPFDISLPGVECRSGGNYTVIFTFNNSLSNVDSAATSQGAGTISSGAIGSDPRQYVVSLSGITNAQDLTITLTNITDSFGNNAATVNVVMSVLIGDINADRAVNSADIAQTKSRSGQLVSATNFRSDVNADGSLNSADIALVKSRSGTALP